MLHLPYALLATAGTANSYRLRPTKILIHRVGVPEMVRVMRDGLSTAITFAPTRIAGDHIVTRAQGEREDSGVLQGT